MIYILLAPIRRDKPPHTWKLHSHTWKLYSSCTCAWSNPLGCEMRNEWRSKKPTPECPYQRGGVGFCEMERSEMEVKTKSRREERTEGGTLQIATPYELWKYLGFLTLRHTEKGIKKRLIIPYQG